jgi:CRISPR-associated protein Cas1
VTSPASDPRPPVAETILYVTTQGTQLGCRENQFVVRDVSGSDNRDGNGSSILSRFPVKKIETINVFGRGVDVTSGVIAAAANTETIINYFTTNGRFRGRFTPASSSVAHLHRQQHALETTTRRTIASQFVEAKITNGLRYLQRKNLEIDRDSPLREAGRKLETAETMDQLRGIEGEAARSYFEQYDATLVDDWIMAGRSRRPPGDEVNALLSLAYTFMQRECESALRQVNLDPYVGVFHVMRHGRPALALDLLEEFRRAFADPFVARLINRGVIKKDAFTSEVELTDAAFDQFVAKYDAFMDETLSHERVERTLTRREVVRLQATFLRKRITGELETYPPLRISR